ncbi:hypothetical protein N9917_03220 [Deltaproteobacteria bacterium]|nr:hypothetical protein [Deltaproteobacteria bacterium]
MKPKRAKATAQRVIDAMRREPAVWLEFQRLYEANRDMPMVLGPWEQTRHRSIRKDRWNEVAAEVKYDPTDGDHGWTATADMETNHFGTRSEAVAWVDAHLTEVGMTLYEAAA